MSDVGKALLLLVLVLAAVGACVQWQAKEDCKQRGGELVRVERSTYECANPDVP